MSKKNFLAEYFMDDNTPIDNVVEICNEYFESTGSSFDYCAKFVYSGPNDDLADRYSDLNMYLNSCHIQPAEAFCLMHHGKFGHYETCNYALCDLNGAFYDIPSISFPCNNEIRKSMAAQSEAIIEVFEQSIKNGNLTEGDPAYDFYQQAKERKKINTR